MSIMKDNFCSSFRKRPRMHRTFSIKLRREDSAFSERVAHTHEFTSFSYDQPKQATKPIPPRACRCSSATIASSDSAAAIPGCCTWPPPGGCTTGTTVNGLTQTHERILLIGLQLGKTQSGKSAALQEGVDVGVLVRLLPPLLVAHAGGGRVRRGDQRKLVILLRNGGWLDRYMLGGNG